MHRSHVSWGLSNGSKWTGRISAFLSFLFRQSSMVLIGCDKV